MIINEKMPRRTIEIDLDGPQGNAFYLLGMASKLCSQIGYDWKEVEKEMKAGNYEHLIQTFDKYFGTVVTMYRSNSSSEVE